MIKLCTACSTSYEDDASIRHCKICEDDRQFVPVSGQHWLAGSGALSRLPAMKFISLIRY